MSTPTAKADYDRERRKDPKVARRARARARAAGRAYRELARRHPGQYRALYLAAGEKLAHLNPPNRRYANAQSRARIELKKYHTDEYRDLYRQYLTKEGL